MTVGGALLTAQGLAPVGHDRVEELDLPAVAAPFSNPRSRTSDVICNLAHDLRQPLSAIEAIAYYLERTLPKDQLEIRKHLLRVQELVADSSTILSEAVAAARVD